MDVQSSEEEKRLLLINNIDKIPNILKAAVKGDDQQLFTRTEKFLKHFVTLSSFPSNARLASALHCFESEAKGTSISIKSGLLRRGKNQSTGNCYREEEVLDKRQGSSSIRMSAQYKISYA